MGKYGDQKTPKEIMTLLSKNNHRLKEAGEDVSERIVREIWSSLR